MATKTTTKTTKPAAKKASVKIASAETLKLVDQQKEMIRKSAGKPIMPPVKPVVEVAVQSKADIARALFKKMNGKNTRQEILAAFITKASLTKAGANTYYANMKKENS